MGVVVLAAGAGSRFAGDTHKLLASFRGRPVVTWAVEHAVAAAVGPTLVVTGAVPLDGMLPDDVEIRHNHRWADGQATSLRTAIEWAEPLAIDAIVVGLGDQPLVAPEAWRLVAAGDGEHPITVATYGGQRGNPVRLARAIWSRLPSSGDAGARRLMADRPDLVGEIPCPGVAADIDTLEDLERWS